MIHALLFDLDGTLLDSRDAVIDAVAHTAEKYAPGHFSREELLGRFGESFDDFLAAVAEAAGMPDKKEVLDDYFAYVRENHEQHVKLFPFVREGLEKLLAAGYELAIVTNKQREFALAGLELAGIDHLFASIVTVDDVSQGKPSAEPVQKALAELGRRPEQAMMIGDSRFDVLAAVGANVQAVVLEWYGPEEWQHAVPDYRFVDFEAFVGEMLTVKMQGGI
ncbi:HAD family hydrolase [Brevibacillus centrosporus]|uniref:HAD family hydrolase n=1 Tax=Brevibacillus centrosporus TaxID=54910 RepID=UPI000F0A7FBB|nr:HAD-IA family hydrolase [Brevibacillus centrosporus]MEC2127408.1 HAD-IA family hydrolase [Brevibacillus centrosporus]MED4907293.1 HAD-IA family hydrolase [Brevibacillus centrosporus]RNB67962.1 HAD family hydrolase [Brevibacillus centrosporus]GED30054.1 pyrophosphatase PpaX [Brevibacillus centrosporus]